MGRGLRGEEKGRALDGSSMLIRETGSATCSWMPNTKACARDVAK